jgi:hypothetical protein
MRNGQFKQSLRTAMGELRFRLGGSAGTRRNIQRILKTVGLGVGYAAFVEPSLVETTQVPVTIASLRQVLDGYRIAHLTDLHYSKVSGARFISRVVAKTRALDPDLVAVTGDLIALNPRSLEQCLEALAELDPPDGIWLVRGNHDYKASEAALERACERAGVLWLKNEHRVIAPARLRSGANAPQAQLIIGGVEDLWEGKCLPGEALAGATDSLPTILLSHNPQVIRLLDRLSVDLVLSGHTHGGQIRPLGRSIKTLSDGSREFSSGRIERGRTVLYVSRGVGTSAFRLRWNCRPEIALITLHPAVAPHAGR